MSQFNKDKVDDFLGTVRKYMQMRGGLSQKDLSELTDIGVSTMSRFLNKKTNELDPQMIAKIVAKLNIPLYEVIDFVEEEFSDKFKRLVLFFKEEDEEIADQGVSENEKQDNQVFSRGDDADIASALGTGGTAKRDTEAKVKIGGKTRSIHFESDGDSKHSQKSIREKLEGLSPRQKAYLSDFLNLDLESKDLMVDIGNSLFRYFRQKGMEL